MPRNINPQADLPRPSDRLRQRRIVGHALRDAHRSVRVSAFAARSIRTASRDQPSAVRHGLHQSMVGNRVRSADVALGRTSQRDDLQSAKWTWLGSQYLQPASHRKHSPRRPAGRHPETDLDPRISVSRIHRLEPVPPLPPTIAPPHRRADVCRLCGVVQVILECNHDAAS